MAEKKQKRYRPTLTEVRALRNELEATKENYSFQIELTEKLTLENRELKKRLENVKENDQWHEKYDELKKKFQDIELSRTMLKDSLDKCKAEKKVVDEKLSDVLKDYDAVCAENISLKARNFWKRLFNK